VGGGTGRPGPEAEAAAAAIGDTKTDHILRINGLARTAARLSARGCSGPAALLSTKVAARRHEGTLLDGLKRRLLPKVRQ